MIRDIKKVLSDTFFVVAFVAVILWMMWYGTSADVWYAGEHDSNCETCGIGDCGCYQRLTQKSSK